ncbi:radial spoke head 10 homolog B isoform 2-T2 [Pelodytes ibericus]
MGKAKKKDGKKADKLTVENSEENSSKISSVSVTPTEELSSPSFKSIPHEEPVKQEEPPVSVPVSEVYEEPVLAQLIVERYEGDTVHGLYEGDGVAFFIDGNIYRGTFSEGLMHGKGTYTWADGLTYEGEFSMNFPMGHGVYIWPNGCRYEGQVYKAIRQGNGIFISSNQQVSYAGEWRKGAKHGKGAIYYNAEGTSWYDGEWIKNNKEGWGVQCFKNGNIYEGQWKNNKFHGEGRMRWLSSNQEYMGQWVNGIQNGHGTHTWFLKRVVGSQYSLRNEYVGKFANGERQGHGQFYYANGAMYDGEWKNNKKHGMGKFIFKNGKIYVGEFVEDQIAEFPNFKYDRVNTPDLSGIRTQSPINAEKLCSPRSRSGIPSLSGSYIELDISSLLNTFPENKQLEELKQVEYAILRNLSELRKIYRCYSSLGCESSVDNAFLMTKLQFWRFLKDCRFHHYNLTLSEMDRILIVDNAEKEGVHSPHATMLLRTFLTNIIYLAYHICHKEMPENIISIVDCFAKVMTNNILPFARNINGFLFCDSQKTTNAMCYIDKCWEIYRLYCQPNTSAPHEPTMKMRHFIWLMNDLKITGKGLSVTDIVDILADDDPSVRNGNDFNLELELTFLEFFEALLGCAVVCVKDDLIEPSNKELYIDDTRKPELEDVRADVIEQQLEHVPQETPVGTPEDQAPKNGSKATSKSQTPSSPTYSTKYMEPERKTEKWFHQISIFFMKIFFPECDYAERIKREIPKIKQQQAEQARNQLIKEEEEARYKLKMAEEAKRIQTMEMEMAAAAILEAAPIAKEISEEEKHVQLPVTPKEEPPVLPPPSSTRTTPATGKKKRK